MTIPFVRTRVRPGEDQVLATSVFKLESLQSEHRLEEPLQSAERSRRLLDAHSLRVRLLALAAQWDHPLTLELHLASHPSFDRSRPPRIHAAIAMHTTAPSLETALEHCLSGSMAIENLLATFLPQMDFKPVSAAQELQDLLHPFAPESCLAVGRRLESLSLALPFREAPAVPGFQTPPGHKPPQHAVDHLSPWSAALDDWEPLLHALLAHPAPQWIVVRMGNRAGDETCRAMTRLESTVSACERFLACAPPDQTTLSRQAAAIRDISLQYMGRLREGALRGSVLLLAPGPEDPILAALLGQSISASFLAAQPDHLHQGGFATRQVSPETALDPLGYFEQEPFTCDESACAFRLPLIFGEEDCGLNVRRHRTIAAALPPTSAPRNELALAGVNRHRGIERPIEIPLEHRLRHMAVFGMTGCGKSTMLESLFLQDLRAGHGAFDIEQHGVREVVLISRFPRESEKDLIVIDFEDRERPIPMNLLAWKTLEERDLIIDELLSALLRVYRNPDMFGPIFEQNFRGVLKLMMGDKPNPEFAATLLDFPKVYLSAAFRRRLADRIDDEQVKDFVAEAERVSYGDGKLENMAPYITNKFGRFLQDTLLRRILGHGAMAFDFRQILDEGKVVILKLARGRFGANVSDLITSQIVSRFRLAAMARSGQPRDQRKPFFLYVDEFGTLAGDENFAQLLSESRKYGLGLVLAAQYARQLRERSWAHCALSAVLGNVGTILAYRVGVEDAPLLAPLFAPSVTAQDLIECPNWQGYMRLHLNQCPARPFSFHNCPDAAAPDYKRAARLREASRQRWGVPAEECDQRAIERIRYIRSLEQ